MAARVKATQNADDTGGVGFALEQLAAILTLLDDLHSEALELDYSKIGASMGLNRDDIARHLTTVALEAAGQALVRARKELQVRPTEANSAPTVHALDGGRA